MDVPVYESERRVILRIQGREPQLMSRQSVASFDPIPAHAAMSERGFWVEVDPCPEPTAVCVVPPGSAWVHSGGKRFLRVHLAGIGLPGPTVMDAFWLRSWSKSRVYGLRLRDEVAGAAGGGEDGDGLAGAGAGPLAVDALAGGGAPEAAAEHPAVEPEPAFVLGRDAPGDGWLF